MPSDAVLAQARGDFRVFLYLIWKHLGLPSPTPAQYDIARYLQTGPRRKCILAFRGEGKSWITSAFVLWLLWNNPELKILVVSASKERADSFSIFTKRLLAEVAFLSHLTPDPRVDRDSNVAFDVRGCRPAHAPSVKSVGITGQIAGSRADHIICDDAEVPNNSETATQREKLAVRVAELGGAVLTPESQNKTGGVIFLGTPQVEDSLYVGLEEHGYEIRIWPAQMPEETSRYRGNLAPFVLEGGFIPGEPIDPARFDNSELAARLVEYGRAGYALQFMLDTSLSDEDAHPLKTRDLIVTDIDVDVAPDYLVWSGSDENTLEHLPRVGLVGDRFQQPMKVSEKFSPFQTTLMYIDPSGRGRDQTAYIVLKVLNGMVFIADWGGIDGGYESAVLAKLATIARDLKVQRIIVEDNFGNGMYAQLLRPIVQKIVKFKRPDGDVQEGAGVEDHTVHGQKEIRAIQTIEPVLSGHRLIIDEALVKRIVVKKEASLDPDAALKSGFYQMTRLTKDRGCLKYDDWIDCLAGGLGWLSDQLNTDTSDQVKDRQAERLEEELLKFEEGILGKSKRAKTWGDRLTSERQ